MATASPDEQRERYLTRQARYNTSAKGRARNIRYEETHPERGLRWEPSRHYGGADRRAAQHPQRSGDSIIMASDPVQRLAQQEQANKNVTNDQAAKIQASGSGGKK